MNLSLRTFGFEDCTHEFLLSYIEFLHKNGNSETTCNNRIVAITDKTAEHLKNYLKFYHEVIDPDAPLIYTVIKGHKDRMSVGNVERIIKKYAVQIRSEYPKLPERCYPHMFRRTRATNLYQDGTELELVSRILGHSSTETTRIYAVPSVDMMRKVMESGNLKSDEKPLWTDDETELARICGLR